MDRTEYDGDPGYVWMRLTRPLSTKIFVTINIKILIAFEMLIYNSLMKLKAKHLFSHMG